MNQILMFCLLSGGALVILLMVQINNQNYSQQNIKLSHPQILRYAYDNQMIKSERVKEKKFSTFKQDKARLNSKIARYIRMKKSEKDKYNQKTKGMKNSTVVVYNKINKSGSTTIKSINFSDH